METTFFFLRNFILELFLKKENRGAAGKSIVEEKETSAPGKSTVDK